MCDKKTIRPNFFSHPLYISFLFPLLSMNSYWDRKVKDLSYVKDKTQYMNKISRKTAGVKMSD